MNKLRRQFLLVVSVLLLLLTSLGCEKVPMPTSDSTPPTLKWSVIPESGPTQQITGSGTITALAGETYTVTLTAEDPQGIHEITLGSSTFWQCISGDIGQNHGPSLDASDVQTLQPDSDGNVLTSIFLIRDVNFGPFNCQSGYTLTGASVTLFGKGENYFGGITEGTLQFTTP